MHGDQQRAHRQPQVSQLEGKRGLATQSSFYGSNFQLDIINADTWQAKVSNTETQQHNNFGGTSPQLPAFIYTALVIRVNVSR